MVLSISRAMWALAAVTTALAGCRPPPPVYIVTTTPAEISVAGPPPAVRLEAQPPRPDPNHTWQPGYWHWSEDEWEYQWVMGTWVESRPGYSLVSASYLFVNNIWIYRPPYWQRRALRHRLPPRHRPGHRHPRPHPQKNRPAKDPPATVRHTAPPSKDADTPVTHVAPPSHGSSAAPAHVLTPRPRTAHPTVRIKEVPDLGAEEAGIREPPEQEKVIKGRPEFRGEQEGRLVFGDDPDVSRIPYKTDRTGAIVLPKHKGKVMVRKPPRPRARPTPGPRPRIHREPLPRPRVRPTPGPRPRIHRTPPNRPRVMPRPAPRPRIQHRPRVQHRPTPRPRIHRPPPPKPRARRQPAPRPTILRMPRRAEMQRLKQEAKKKKRRKQAPPRSPRPGNKGAKHKKQKH